MSVFLGDLLPVTRTINRLGFLPLSRDPGFLFLHPPYQDCAGHGATPQLLLGPYTGMAFCGWVGIQGEGDIGTLLASFDWLWVGSEVGIDDIFSPQTFIKHLLSIQRTEAGRDSLQRPSS